MQTSINSIFLLSAVNTQVFQQCSAEARSAISAALSNEKVVSNEVGQIDRDVNPVAIPLQ